MQALVSEIIQCPGHQNGGDAMPSECRFGMGVVHLHAVGDWLVLGNPNDLTVDHGFVAVPISGMANGDGPGRVVSHWRSRFPSDHYDATDQLLIRHSVTVDSSRERFDQRAELGTLVGVPPLPAPRRKYPT